MRADEVLVRMNAADSPAKKQKRVNEMSKHFEDAIAASLKALEGLNAVIESPPIKLLTAAVQSLPDGRVQLTATGLPAH